ncbi:hypothetical protein QFZ28_003075 [Neobacillus niacini]|uniref:hypothetical protein n=1 Tax=Neobacillus niacini TaxID=86668 RepID=UPI002782DDC3|nr:hypothetical protein [Neobacillus niacini]MDQ1002675.1 hypothetical protein [Neobacillus niacini]
MKKLVAGLTVAATLVTGFAGNGFAKGSGETVDPTGNEFFWKTDKAFKGDNVLSWVNSDENYEIFHVTNVEDNHITKKQLRMFKDGYNSNDIGYVGGEVRVLSFDKETNDLYLMVEYYTLSDNVDIENPIEWTDETMTQDWINWAKSQGQYTTEGSVNTSQNAGWIYAVGMQPWFDNTAVDYIESTYKLNVTSVEHRTMPDGQPETIFYVTK